MGKVLKADLSVTHTARSQGAAAIVEGRLYGVNASGNLVAADRSTPVRAVGVAFKPMSAANAVDKPVTLFIAGIVELETADIEGAWTVGAAVYLGLTGKYTTVKPTTATNIAQVIGTSLSANRVFVQVQPLALTVQAAATSNIVI